MSDIGSFIDGMPKAELHLHLEGTLEPELKFALAARNGVSLGYRSAGEMRAGYAFRDLTSFLAAYYEGMSVLLTEQDFYDLAMAYFRTASAQNVVYAEVFFDPQAHTSRGIGFETVIGGLHRAWVDAQADLGLRVQLIMCFLRDMTADSAMATLEESLAYQDLIVGVGLDSDERDNPPVKFKEVFDRARAAGYRLTMHCDVDQADSVGHIWQCLDDIGVERIDHGVNCVEDDALVARLARDGIGLTVCPVSNRWVSDGLKAAELKFMLDRSLRATVNSDDPAYFGAYVNQNLAAAAEAVGLRPAEVARLVGNSFEIAWLDTADRARYLADLDAYVSQSARLGHAELVALRVVEGDGAAADVVGPPGQGRARLDQALHVLAHQPLALLAPDLAPGHPHVEVDAVLGRLGFGHTLEVQPRALARRVDPGGHLAELLFRYPDRAGKGVPALEALWRRLDHVAQRQPPELGQLLGLGGVEHDLDLGVHGGLLTKARLRRHPATHHFQAVHSWAQSDR